MSKCLTIDCRNESRYQSGLCGVCDALANVPTERHWIGCGIVPSSETTDRRLTATLSIENVHKAIGGDKTIQLSELGELCARAAATNNVLDEVREERIRQHAKWGEQSWPDGKDCLRYNWAIHCDLAKNVCNRNTNDGSLTWTDILNEEVLEAFAESNEALLRFELVQVAAVAVAWIEAIDRRGVK